jgi:hypothetical protein
MKEVVSIEPTLQPLTGSHNTAYQDSAARLDIVADGLWGDPAPSHQDIPLTSCYRRNEEKKKNMIKELETFNWGFFSHVVVLILLTHLYLQILLQLE